MPFASGVFHRVYSWVADRAAGGVVDPAKFDTDMNDMAVGLSTCVLRDGTGVPTADLPMGGKALTGIRAGTTSGESVEFAQMNTAISTAVTAGVNFAVASDVQTGTSALKSVTPASLSGSSVFQTLSFVSTVLWNAQSGYNAKLTLTASTATLSAITNPVEGQSYTLQIIQDSMGSRTMLFNAAYDFGQVSSPFLSTAANAIDMVYMLCINATSPRFKCSFSRGS